MTDLERVLLVGLAAAVLWLLWDRRRPAARREASPTAQSLSITTSMAAPSSSGRLCV